uniref:NADH-ubiquinone oxidoreductase chain 6 n=1 Tax=Sternopriscus clavatus TaxID=521640 RepID=A0A894JRG2_9DYTI|nr:NADH dehydrogenase subunit 6 [Sternopriscus clavatus]
MTLIILLNLMFSFTFLFLNHPMSMGLILMIHTILISLITGMYTYSFWFSYILFLIMIGGMLILFMYMTSLASNEKFKFSLTNITTNFIMVFFMILIYMNIDKSMISYMYKNSNIYEMINQIMMFKNENLLSMNLMYNNPNYLITLCLINYLFITLIIVVKITKYNKGPLRQKF